MSRRRLQQTARLRDHQGIADPARGFAVIALRHSYVRNEATPDQPEGNQQNHDEELS